jgi:hypothetical protein
MQQEQQEETVAASLRPRFGMRPSRIGALLGILSIYLAAQSIFNEYLIEKVLTPGVNDTAIVLLDLFSVNSETTIPTWYAVLLLIAAAALLGVIALAKWRQSDRFRYYWAGLALIFVYLSMDEGAAIHEILSDPLGSVFHTSGFFSFGWVIVAIPLVIAFAIVFIPFLLHLSWRWRLLFATSGLVYVGGALIIEAISADEWSLQGGITLPYLAIGTVEELCEMLGMSLFIYCLLAYIAENRLPLPLAFAASAAGPQVSEGDRAEDGLGVSSPAKARSKAWKWLALLCLLIFLLIANAAVFLGAKSAQRANASAPLESAPFYRAVIDQYGGEGVVILGLGGAFQPGSPLTQQMAESLIVLFKDVAVVSLPRENTSVAFASSTSLPFDKEALRLILLDSQEEDFTIYDTQEIRAMRRTDSP